MGGFCFVLLFFFGFFVFSFPILSCLGFFTFYSYLHLVLPMTVVYIAYVFVLLVANDVHFKNGIRYVKAAYKSTSIMYGPVYQI